MRGKREREKRKEEKGWRGKGTASAACRYSMPIHIQPGVEKHEANRK